jgi:hypothetical protein
MVALADTHRCNDSNAAATYEAIERGFRALQADLEKLPPSHAVEIMKWQNQRNIEGAARNALLARRGFKTPERRAGGHSTVESPPG